MHNRTDRPDLDSLMEAGARAGAADTSRREREHQKGVIARLRRHSRGFIAGALLAWTATVGVLDSEPARAQVESSMQRVAELVGLENRGEIAFEAERLEPLVEEMEKGSPTFALYLDAIRESNHNLTFVDLQQRREAERERGNEERAEDLHGPGHTEYLSAHPYTAPQRTPEIQIGIDFERLLGPYQQLGERFPDFQDTIHELGQQALKRQLAWETGHAFSMALTNNAHACPDTQWDWGESCAARRMSQVAQELPDVRVPEGMSSPLSELVAHLRDTGQVERLKTLARRFDDRLPKVNADRWTSWVDQQLKQMQDARNAPRAR